MKIRKLIPLSLSLIAALSFLGCENDESSVEGFIIPKASILSGSITKDTYLTKDRLWTIAGSLAVVDNSTLKIEAGTTIIGRHGGGAETSYLVIDKNSKIIAEGTENEHITFTSDVAYYENGADYGEWGGVILIGNAGNPQVRQFEARENLISSDTNMNDNSGILRYVDILHSGSKFGKEDGEEINGLSLIGVGNQTTIDNIFVDYSKDDCIEIWGGTVNFTNLTVSNCQDDGFDIDDGYVGNIENLTITDNGTGNSPIEISGGNSVGTFNNVNITRNNSGKGGFIYFKNGGSGGGFNPEGEGSHFSNVSIINNLPDTYTDGIIYVNGIAQLNSISFTNVSVTGTYNGGNYFVGKNGIEDDTDEIESIFINGTNNTIEVTN